MDLQKSFEGMKAQIRELFSKLTASQKITIGLLTALMAIAVVVLVRMAGGESYIRLAAASDAKSSAALRGVLDGNGIPYRISGEGGGSIEVPRDRAAHARWLAAESGITDTKDNLDWLFGEGSLLDTEKRIDQRLLESRRKTVEDAIRWSPSIRDVRIVVQRGPEPIYANRTNSSDTASVAVALRPGTDALARQEAATIRTLVAGAFNILPQNIGLTDDRLRNYGHVEGPISGISEEDDRTRRIVLSTVENLLGRIYRPSEFVVGVLVDLSTHRSQIARLTYPVDGVATAEKSTARETEKTNRGPGSPVGVEPNVAAGGLGSATPVPAVDSTSKERREVVSESRFSTVEEKVDVPAGEVKGVSVNVVLDRTAVRRVLQAEEFLRLTPEEQKTATEPSISNFTLEGKRGQNNLDQAIEAHRKAQSDFLRDQIPMSGAKVNVSAVVFPRPEMPVVAAASTRALGWAANHWSDLLLAGVAVLGLFVVYRMFRQAMPPPLDIPSLDESVLDAETEAGDEEVRTLETELATVGARHGNAGTAEEEEQDEEVVLMTERVRAVKAAAKGNPEVASAVVRLWISGQDGKE
jgi:flagellar biosynthesis/type III secretory pathway M-ring protein FliF/YscJ